MNEPLIAPEDNFAVNSDREHIRPAFTFKGRTLAPYSKGSRRLYAQVCEENDLVVYRTVAFVYIHINPREEMCALAWNLPKFRKAVLDWMDDLSDAEEAEAQKIVSDIIANDQATAVEVIPPPGKDKKKLRARGRRRGQFRGSKLPSVENSTSAPPSSSGKRQAQS